MGTRKQAKLILIVEDDPDIGELIKVIVEKNGYQAKICNDGKNLQKTIKDNPPSLIFMDLWIPGINGSTLTKKLKGSSKTKHIPVIITSAQNSLDKIVAKTGADGFLAKPFDISSISFLIKKYLAG